MELLHTPADSPDNAAPAAPTKARSRRVAGWALLAVAVGVGLLFALSREPSPAERGQVPKHWPHPQGTFKNSVVRRMPMWVWRVRDWVRGPRRMVTIDVHFIALESWSAEDVERLGLGAPALAEANAVRVWLVPSNQVKTTRSALSKSPGGTSFASPRVQTADGTPATLYLAGGPIGKRSNSFSTEAVCSFEPQVRGEGLDLKAILSCESHKTAAAAPIAHPDPLSLRVQIRDGQGVLVLQENRAGLGGKPLAVWIQAAPMPKK
jgi:hypothetical protein